MTHGIDGHLGMACPHPTSEDELAETLRLRRSEDGASRHRLSRLSQSLSVSLLSSVTCQSQPPLARQWFFLRRSSPSPSAAVTPLLNYSFFTFCLTVPLNAPHSLSLSSRAMKRRRLLCDSDDEDAAGAHSAVISLISDEEDAGDIASSLFPSPPPSLIPPAGGGMRNRKAGRVPSKSVETAEERSQERRNEAVEEVLVDWEEEGGAERVEEESVEGSVEGSTTASIRPPEKKRRRLKKVGDLTASEAADERLRILHAEGEAMDAELLEEERRRKVAVAEARKQQRQKRGSGGAVKSKADRQMEKNAAVFASIIRHIGL